LRERREDIPLLAAHFARAAARRMKVPVQPLSQAQARLLSAHDWPGNVRELQNAVERAVILSQGRALKFDTIGVTSNAPLPADREPVTRQILTRKDLKQRERESIIAALEQTGGKIFGTDGAAALLGMKPTTLASRVSALGLKRKVSLINK
jgi:DNA-binding NtrC family response regulator